MHNGMLRTLPDVLRFYNKGRSENPNVVDRDDDDDREGRRGGNGGVASLSGGFRRVGTMSQGDIRDIVAFLGIPDGHELRQDDSGEGAERVATGRLDPSEAPWVDNKHRCSPGAIVITEGLPKDLTDVRRRASI